MPLKLLRVGLYSAASMGLSPWILPSIFVGVPIGAGLSRHVRHETFRRVCMSFDAYLVSFGLARTLTAVGVPPVLAYQLMVITAIIDGRLLYVYFRPAVDKAVDRAAALV